MKISNSILSLKAVVFLIACCSFMNVNAQLPALKQCTPSLIPTFSTGCATGGYIASLTTTGGINNITNNNTNCGNTSISYSDYTGTAMKVKQEALKSIKVNISWVGYTTNNVISTLNRIYVDWNRDGDFMDNGEYIAPNMTVDHTQAHNTTKSFDITVPGFAKEGLTRMRVVTGATFLGQFDPGTSACGTANYGEAEDYVFEVVNPCLPPNVISIANVNYKSADFSWTPKQNAEFYEYLITPVDIIPHDTISGFTFTTNTSVDVDTFKCDTKYYTLVRIICDTAGKIAKNWKRSSWIRDSFVTEPCCYVPVITVDKVSSTTARVSWDPIATALGYEYAVSVSNESRL